jgi:hypothetical protein
MKGMGQEVKINITKKKRIIVNKILSITLMRHLFVINKCKKKRTKERSKPGKLSGRQWREKKRMRSNGAQADLPRRSMMMRISHLSKKLKRRRIMVVTPKNLKMKKMNWTNTCVTLMALSEPRLLPLSHRNIQSNLNRLQAFPSSSKLQCALYSLCNVGI